MKKQVKKSGSKFSIEKFEVAKLKNMKSINGGDGNSILSDTISDDKLPTVRTFGGE